MLTIDRMTDKLSSSVAVAVLSGLVVLPLAWRLLVASNNGNKSQHGTRKVFVLRSKGGTRVAPVSRNSRHDAALDPSGLRG
ncbi:hypothetical protein PC111_g22786, partial [Phytophthora cactorum]